MTTTTPPPVTLSQVLGPAARKSNAVLTHVLDKSGVTFNQWVCLNMLAATDSSASREALVQQASARFELGPEAVTEALSGLESRRTVSASPGAGASAVRLTAEGEVFFQQLRGEVDAITGALLAGIDQADLSAATATLQAIIRRAPSVLASWEARNNGA